MLKYDMESKGVSEVPQGNQAESYFPSESELQMAQVGYLIALKKVGVLR